MDKRKVGLFGAILALILFFAVNVLASTGLRSLRVDLTEGKLYTLAEGSKRIVWDLDEPIRLYLYVSEDVARAQAPFVLDYANRVRDVLEEFVAASNGNLLREVIEPEPFSEEEERAVRDGVAGIPLSETDTLYFGLVATSAASEKPEVIPFFGEIAQGTLTFDRKERFLEYDLARMIFTLAHPDKKTVGVLSSLPIEGAAPANPYMQQAPTPPWKILDQIRSFFDLRIVDAQAEELPGDLDALVVIHPKALSEKMLYAIDQYVLGGGRLVAFVDPHCEADETETDPTNPMSRFEASRSSDLNRLFQAWGFELVPNKVALDRLHALSVQMPRGQSFEVIPYLAWLGLGEGTTAADDPVTSLLSLINVKSSGILRATADATTTFEPLLFTSEESMESDVGALKFMPDPQGLIRNFVPGYQSLTLAARVSGEAKSAFPDGLDKTDETAEDGADDAEAADAAAEDEAASNASEEEQADGSDPEPAAGENADAGGHVALSNGPIHVIAFADADLLADDAWIREQRLGPINLGYSKISYNDDLLIGAIENLLGGEELTGIRARGRFQRPFEKVDEMRSLAQQRYQSEQEELERRLRESQDRINALQKEKSPDASSILSPEQAAELDKLQEDLLATKKRLREVLHDRNRDIESYGKVLTVLNIGLIPLVLSGAAIALGAWRVQQRGKT